MKQLLSLALLTFFLTTSPFASAFEVSGESFPAEFEVTSVTSNKSVSYTHLTLPTTSRV